MNCLPHPGWSHTCGLCPLWIRSADNQHQEVKSGGWTDRDGPNRSAAQILCHSFDRRMPWPLHVHPRSAVSRKPPPLAGHDACKRLRSDIRTWWGTGLRASVGHAPSGVVTGMACRLQDAACAEVAVGSWARIEESGSEYFRFPILYLMLLFPGSVSSERIVVEVVVR